MTQNDFYRAGRTAVAIQGQAIDRLLGRLDDSFSHACERLLACRGRIIVTGMGKSGHIANKIAATLASTGSPAFFMHPGEAGHGDLGMMTRDDIVLALSYSGTTEELLLMLPVVRQLNIALIALTGNADSPLARAATVHVDVGVEKEACPLNLAPTASTTAALVMGDALAVALLEARGFTEQDFALSHPAGYLGKKLLLTVGELMHTGERIPKVDDQASLKAALLEMSRKNLGIVAVVDRNDKLLGVLTDGDLRRLLQQDADLNDLNITAAMTRGGKTVRADTLAAEALALMERHQIFPLIVVDDARRPVGALNMHDLFRAGLTT